MSVIFRSVLDSLVSSPSTKYTAPSELSLDARALHDALPNIDYLTAAWITFPVKGTSE